jgi:hypothetical protein
VWAAGGTALLAPLVRTVADAASVVLLRPGASSPLAGSGILSARVTVTWCEDAQSGAVAAVPEQDAVNALGDASAIMPLAAAGGAASAPSTVVTAGAGRRLETGAATAVPAFLSPSPGFAPASGVGIVASTAVAMNSTSPLDSVVVIAQLLAYLRRDAAASALQAMASGLVAAAAAPLLSTSPIPPWAASPVLLGSLTIGNATAGPLVSLVVAAAQSPLGVDPNAGGAPAAAAGDGASEGLSAAALGGIGGAVVLILGLAAAALVLLMRRRKRLSGRRALTLSSSNTAKPGVRAGVRLGAGAASQAQSSVRHPKLGAADADDGGGDGSQARRAQGRGATGTRKRAGVGMPSARGDGDDVDLQLSVNPLASRSALSFAPTTISGVAAGAAAHGPAAGVGAKAARDPRQERPASRPAAVAPARREASNAASALAFASGGAGRRGVSASSGGTGRARRRVPKPLRGADAASSASSSDSEPDSARPAALRPKKRVEQPAVLSSGAAPKTASGVATARLSSRALLGEGAAAASAVSLLKLAASPASREAPPDASPAAAHAEEPPADSSGTVDTTINRRAVVLGASAGKGGGGAAAANGSLGLRDLRAYKATSVRNLKAAMAGALDAY